MVTKPTKQQIEQGKARAGGNNPVKVTKAGVKRLGQAALIAASLTPIGRTAKIAGIIAKPISKVIQAKSVKNTKVVVEKIAKMQEKARAERIASNSVKLKPAAKQIPNPRDAAKIRYKKELTDYKQRAREDDWVQEDINLPRSPERTPVKINSTSKQTITKTEAKANARGLKAANKPLSKGNKKLVTQVKQQTGYIAMDRRPTPPTVAAALKKGSMGSFIAEAKKIAM